MMQSQHVAIMIHDGLLDGGSERFVQRLAAHLATFTQVTVLSACDPSDDLLGVPPGVGRVGLARGHRRTGRIRESVRLVLRLRSWLRAQGPDVLLTVLPAANIIGAVATLGSGIRLVTADRNDRERAPHAPMKRWMELLAHRTADSVTVNSFGSLRVLQRACGPGRVLMLPNPIPSFAPAAELANTRRVIGIGRLVKQKRHDLALRAFAHSGIHRSGWRLDLLGQGPLQRELERLADELGVGSAVRFLGWHDGPERALADSELFLMLSDFEGTPNALLEAMTVGLPCVVRRTVSWAVAAGGQQACVLVDGWEDAAEQLRALGQDRERRASLGAAARVAVQGLPDWRGPWRAVLLGDPWAEPEGGAS